MMENGLFALNKNDGSVCVAKTKQKTRYVKVSEWNANSPNTDSRL